MGTMGARKTKNVEVEKRPVKTSALTPAFVGGIFGSIAVIIVGAVLIGKSDNGQINVNATIQNSNQANIDAGGDPSNNVALVREDLRNLPNGGLIPQENQPETPAPAPEATQNDQGTTTESTDTATSTSDTSAEGEDTNTSSPPDAGEGSEPVTNGE